MEDQYQALYTTFRWWVPQRFNIADACCRRWLATSADARRIAIYAEDAGGRPEVWTFARLQEYANRLSNGLRRLGVQRGDRVAIALAQRPEAVVAHIAIYQLGAVSVPLSTALGAETFEQRLRDSEARIVLVDPLAAEQVLPAAERCPLLRQAIGLDLDDERVLSWRTLLARQESAFDMHPTSSSDPAILLYTSGTTGPAKGVILPHGALIGALPGFVASQNWFPQPADVLWTASEWGSGHGLMTALLPALYFGQPLIAHEFTEPAKAFAMLERYRVTNLSLHPMALNRLLKAQPNAATKYSLSLRAIALGGAYSGQALIERCKREMGVLPNETFGQTEVGTVIGHSHEKWPARPGSMGRPYPGHQIGLVTPEGYAVVPGNVGEIVVNRYDMQGHADPALFLSYWRGEESGRRAGGSWHHTGDLARLDDDGYLWYAGRVQDVFGADRAHLVVPDEIEALLSDHPSVSGAAVVASHKRTAGIKAYITLPAATTVWHESEAPASSDIPEGPDAASSPNLDPAALTKELRAYVREHLPAYLVPDEIHVVQTLPVTATGNIRRAVLRQEQDDRARRQPPVPAQAAPAP